MKKLIFLTLSAFFINVSASSQTDSLKQRPGQVSFFYPLGTNGLDATQYTNNFSLNVLYGINGGLNGLEIGGLVNTNLGNVNGAQFAGIANINTKQTNAIMAAGITNIVKDSSNSLAFAGISNIMGKSAMGLHFAGITNTVNGSFTGGQFAGISNTVNGDLVGGQFAGISNITNGNLVGFQAAGISNLVNGNLKGAQASLVNAAKTVSGFQIGLINIAERYEKGVPFGLFNFVKEGYHVIEIAASESIYGNVNLKLGVEQLYTIYKVGFASNKGASYVTYGLGLGSLLSLSDKAKVSLDISGNQIIQPSFTPRLNFLAKSDFAFRYRFSKHIGVFAGPSLNLYVTQHTLQSENHALKVPYSLYKENWWNNSGSSAFWIGGNAGLTIAF